MMGEPVLPGRCAAAAALGSGACAPGPAVPPLGPEGVARHWAASPGGGNAKPSLNSRGPAGTLTAVSSLGLLSLSLGFFAGALSETGWAPTAWPRPRWLRARLGGPTLAAVWGAAPGG